MKWRNSSTRYGLMAVFLHWLAVLLLIALIYTGLVMADMPRGPEKLTLIDLHGAVGQTLAVLMIIRYLWKGLTRQPQPFPDQGTRLNFLKNLIHQGFYFIVWIQVAAGILALFTVGRALDYFGWFQIISPMARDIPAHHFWEDVHLYSWYFLITMVAFHIAAVFYHQVRGHRVIQRML